MSDNSAIEWCDATWNPVTGCTEVSPGCDHCYAKTFAERWRGTPGHHFENGFDVTLRPDKLALPLSWRKPRRVFVNSMSDLFHASVPDEYIARVFAVMVAAPHHTFQCLTKRPARMRSLLCSIDFWSLVSVELGRLWRVPPPRPLRGAPEWIWLGVSVESQKWANIRIPLLLNTPAAVRFLSCEPLLGPVDLSRWLDTPPTCGCGAGLAGASDALGCCVGCMTPEPSGIDWVIGGGESGSGFRPLDLDWARSLRDQCVTAAVPYLFKQVGGRTPKAGGRLLDGRTWDQYPELVVGP
jgi:protein gp37